MELALGIVLVAAGVLLPVAAYHDEIGQIGFGSRSALARQRLLTRGRMLVLGPVLLVIGVLALWNHFSG